MDEVKAPRGFARLSKERQREIASKGGRAAHAKGKAHQFSSEEARAAGRLGGQRVAANRAHMAEIGKRGGVSRQQPVGADDSEPVNASALNGQTQAKGEPSDVA